MSFPRVQLQKLKKGLGEGAAKNANLVEYFARYRYRNDVAHEHALQGACRRLKTMNRCTENVYKLLPPGSRKVPSTAALHDAEINLQAFLFNAFGYVDNLAHIWVWERGIKKPNGENLPASQIGFNQKCEIVRRSLPESILTQLEGYTEWFGYLEDFRHSLAHRIPAYIPPYRVLTADLEAYSGLTLRMMLAPDGPAYSALELERAGLMRFAPFLLHSLENSRPVLFHAQILADFLTLDQLGRAILSELHT